MSEVACAIPGELEEFVTQSIQSGRFTGPGELLVTALFAYREQTEQESSKLARLREDIAVGLHQLEEGDSADWDVENFLRRMKSPAA